MFVCGLLVHRLLCARLLGLSFVSAGLLHLAVSPNSYAQKAYSGHKRQSVIVGSLILLHVEQIALCRVFLVGVVFFPIVAKQIAPAVYFGQKTATSVIRLVLAPATILEAVARQTLFKFSVWAAHRVSLQIGLTVPLGFRTCSDCRVAGHSEWQRLTIRQTSCDKWGIEIVAVCRVSCGSCSSSHSFTCSPLMRSSNSPRSWLVVFCRRSP